MPAWKPHLLRLRTRLAFPALAVAMGLSTLVAGLDHATFLVQASGTREALQSDVIPAPGIDSSTVQVAMAPAVAAPTVAAPLPAGLDTSIQHSRIDAWIHKFSTSLRGDFSKSLTRMDKYAGMITRKLDARDMPHELIYLAMIESDFN